jgi:hypothetical protein
MWIILKYFLLQFLNYWKQLQFRIKIEIVILLTIFYIYVTKQLVFKFSSFLEQSDFTPLHLNMLVQPGLLLPLLIGIPFIYFSLIPRQKNIQLLRLLPLGSGPSAMLLLVHFWKYELIYLIIILPVATAVGITLGPWLLLYLLLVLVLLPSAMFLFLHLLSAIFSSIYKVLFIYLALAILYYLFLMVLYRTSCYILYQIIIYLFLILFVYRFWFRHWEKWDIILDRFRPVPERRTAPSGTINYFTLAPYVPLAIRPVFVKEILLQFRNHRYLRLKVLTLIIFLLGALLIQQYAAENFRTLLAVLVIVLIWWHYSSQFNEKYVLPESKYFLKTMPLRYYQFVLPKFLAELIYIMILTGLVLIIFLLHGEELSVAAMSILSMLMVSIFILLSTIIFKTMFYDNPRLAGYAYHFLILFGLVISVNFYFIGPVITILLLIYFSYKSYQAFSQ